MSRRFPSLLRARRSGLIAVTLAIMLGVGFAAGTLVAGASFENSLRTAIAAQATRSDVVLTAEDGHQLPASLVREVRQTNGVRAVFPLREVHRQVDWPGTGSRLSTLRSLPGSEALRWQQLRSGRWPTRAGEAVVDENTAERDGLRLGQTVSTAGNSARVVGIVRMPFSEQIGAGLPTVLLPSSGMTDWTDAGVAEMYVRAAPAADPLTLRERLADLAGGQVTVRTGEQHAQVLITEFSGDRNILSGVLLAFAAIALFVAALVIGNTFSVLVAQHSRALALLRCVGATRRQVFRSVLAEVGLLAAVTAVAGTIFGLGIGAAVVEVVYGTGSDAAAVALHVPAYAIIVPLLLGIATTVSAAIPPARAATRVRPVTALRAATDDGATRRGRLRPISGTTMVVTGFCILGMGASTGTYLFGIGGALLSAGGVLLLTRSVLPVIIRGLRRPLPTLGGVPGRVAGVNALRNPHRATVTATALLVGVTLVSTLLVAVATAERTLSRQVDDSYPVDVGITANSGELGDATSEQLAGVPDVSASVLLPGTKARIAHRRYTVLGVGPAATELARGVVSPPPGQLLVPPAVARNSDLEYGEQVRITRGEREIRLRVRPSAAQVASLLTSREDLRRLAPSAPPVAQWLRVSPDADSAALVGNLRQVLSSNHSDATLNGTIRARASYQDVFRTSLLVALALLAVSVAIAVIGIANTLSLSVLERTRESALLRALGLTRRQLRASLAWEAVLLALAATAAGIALGCVYGVAGVYSLLELGSATSPTVPAGQLLLIVAGTLAAAMLASVLPARSAVRVSPAAALARE